MKPKPEMVLEKQTREFGTTILLFNLLRLCRFRFKLSVDSDASSLAPFELFVPVFRCLPNPDRLTYYLE